METSQPFYKCLTLIKEFSLTLTEKVAKIASQSKLSGALKTDQLISVLTPEFAATFDDFAEHAFTA